MGNMTGCRSSVSYIMVYSSLSILMRINYWMRRKVWEKNARNWEWYIEVAQVDYAKNDTVPCPWCSLSKYQKNEKENWKVSPRTLAMVPRCLLFWHFCMFVGGYQPSIGAMTRFGWILGITGHKWKPAASRERWMKAFKKTTNIQLRVESNTYSGFLETPMSRVFWRYPFKKSSHRSKVYRCFNGRGKRSTVWFHNMSRRWRLPSSHTGTVNS